MGRSAEDFHHAAVEAVNRGSFAQAQRMLAAAARKSDDPSVQARVAGTLAYILAARGDAVGAERICRDALKAPGVDAHTRAILAGQMGALAERAGRLADAERWLTKGIQALADDPVSRANLLTNRSLVFMQQRRLSRALEDTVAATDIFADLGTPVDAAQSRHNEGYVALLGGDLITALQKMTRARDTLATLSDVAVAVGDVDRAEVLRDAGSTTEAEGLLARAAAVFGANRMRLSRAEAEFNLARSLLTHDPVAAARVARVAARRFDALGNETWGARAHGVRLRAELGGGRVSRDGSRGREPRRVPTLGEVEAAASTLDRHGFRSEAAALRMSYELWCARHGVPLRRPLVRVPKRASMEVRLLAHEVRAVRAAVDGRRTDARRRAAQGLELLSEWQSGFGSLDLQTSIAMHGNGLILAGLDAALRSGDPEVVFDWSERARMLSQQVVPLRPPPDPTLADELAELRMLRAEDPSALESVRAAELRDRARDRQWSATGSVATQERVSLEELRAELDSGTALVSYVFAELGLFALVVTQADHTLLPLDDWPVVRGALPGLRADLDMSASMRGGGIGDIVRRSLVERLATLSGALLDAPLAAAGDVHRLVLTVPGVLSGIPWAMLPAMRGRSFTLAVSATRWAGLHADPAPGPASAGFVVGPRVVRGGEEVDDASDVWTAPRILRERDATVAAVTALAGAVDVLHVAAHGRHAVDNPLFSGLELADGTLFGYDVDLIPDVPATVVLSACEVGRSSVRWGEEAIGMTRVWLHAGTRCVIASPVVVADDDACELLGVMHEGLARGESPADALAAASVRTGIVAPFQAHGAGF